MCGMSLVLSPLLKISLTPLLISLTPIKHTYHTPRISSSHPSTKTSSLAYTRIHHLNMRCVPTGPYHNRTTNPKSHLTYSTHILHSPTLPLLRSYNTIQYPTNRYTITTIQKAITPICKKGNPPTTRASASPQKATHRISPHNLTHPHQHTAYQCIRKGITLTIISFDPPKHSTHPKKKQT
ncbi:hypothetical protein L873DRAFT_1294041 [Choiromyces venosus 120613-1]|uniref:Ig-like domain-containing protein n=1 Tax=Choiromyces venosus 120613-1 TaxID=1336337 RepID=A0A3N4JC93_9PEZI|nr:hypothetical protein L873DRAFT_1294041 [Choiromyces venosus 120613-1]